MAIITSTTLSHISNYRLDAEYYKPKELSLYNTLLKSNCRVLNSFSKVNGGKRLPKGESFSEVGFPYIRVVDINNGFINDDNVALISERIWKLISSYDIKKDDLLVTIVGNTVGLSGILNKDLGVANFTENCARIRNSKIDPYYLLAFLNSKYGHNQVIREKVGTSQPKLALDRLRRFKIFIPSESELSEIASIVRQSSDESIKSKELYKQATDLLECKLGFDKIKLVNPKMYTANFNEVTTTRRMNAEFFSPLVKDILKQPFLLNAQPIKAIFEIKRGVSPSKYQESGIPVIKTKNIRVPEIDKSRIKDYVSSSKELTTIKENDLLLASMGVGSLGRISFIQILDEQYVVDGTIRILRRRADAPENYEIPTLLILSSKVGQELIYRGIVGSTGIISLPDDYLNKIPIPQFENELCERLTNLVKESTIASKKSKELLAQAKARVEQLIEESANS